MKLHYFKKYPNYRLKQVDDCYYPQHFIAGMFGISRWVYLGNLSVGIDSFETALAKIKQYADTEETAEIITHE
jgi:hypothetical protein